MGLTLDSQAAPAINRQRRWRFLIYLLLIILWTMPPWLAPPTWAQIVLYLSGLAAFAAGGVMLSRWERGLRARARSVQWHLCPACLHPLEPGDGACPECGRPYSPESLMREWTNP